MSDLHAQNQQEWRSARDAEDYGSDRPDPSEYQGLSQQSDRSERPPHISQQFSALYQEGQEPF